MRYTIVQGQAYEFRAFIQRVNALIEEGWQPQGGIAVVYTGGNSREYVQAMVKCSPCSEKEENESHVPDHP